MYLELRCKLPRNNGGYGAFWTVSAKSETGNRKTYLKLICLNLSPHPRKHACGAGCGGMTLGPVNFMMEYLREVM